MRGGKNADNNLHMSLSKKEQINEAAGLNTDVSNVVKIFLANYCCGASV